MNANAFASAVSRHITNALGSNLTDDLARKHAADLDQTVTRDAVWHAFVLLIPCVRPPRDLAHMFLLAADTRSARDIARLIVSLADWELEAAGSGEKVSVDKRRRTVAYLFEIYLFGLFIYIMRTSLETRCQCASCPLNEAPVEPIGDHEGWIFGQPPERTVN